MNTHRVRSYASIGENPAEEYFVEIRPDQWLGVAVIPNHEAITEHVESGKLYLTYDTRAFNIGIVKDWVELDPIS